MNTVASNIPRNQLLVPSRAIISVLYGLLMLIGLVNAAWNPGSDGNVSGFSSQSARRAVLTCGAQLSQQKGSAATPNFPNTSPHATIDCHWSIVGQPGHRISLLITELYVPSPGGVKVTGYDDYFAWVSRFNDTVDQQTSPPLDLGFFGAENLTESPLVQTTKTFLVITWIQGNVSASDAQLQPSFHGLNFTYEVSPVTSSPSLLSLPAARFCVPQRCSYLGQCVVDEDFNTTWCQCSDGFFGQKCQYGPECNPFVVPPVSPCNINNGECWYSRPESVICTCRPKLTGERCDTWKRGALPDCSALDCQDGCYIEPETNQARCRCLAGRELNQDLRTCSAATAELDLSLWPLTSSSTQPPPPPYRVVLRDAHGVIQTPNYPGIFPVTTTYEWIIEAGQGKQTVIYFTEIYLKRPGSTLTVYSYEQYHDGRGVNETWLGDFDYDQYPDNLTLTARYIVLRMNLKSSSLANSMLRIKPHFLDIYGFNITYSVFPQGNLMVRKTCHPFECRFTGRCVVSSDYLLFSCECFEGFFGLHCQYGPNCNPYANPPKNPCLNEGKCAITFGAERAGCECLLGFTGARCETRVVRSPVEGCEKLSCEQRCLNGSEGPLCHCNPGFRMINSKCENTGRKVLSVDIDFEPGIGSLLIHTILSKLNNMAPEMEKCQISSFNTSTINFECLADKSARTLIRKQLESAKQNRTRFLDSITRTMRSYKVSSFPVIDLINLTLYSRRPTVEGSELAVVCVVQGSPEVKFTWSKDGVIFDPSKNRGMWLTEIVLDERKSSQVNIENVRRVHQGVFTCNAEDHGAVVTQSLYVDVLRPPEIELVPATPTVRRGEFFSVTCMIQQASTTYRWKRNGEDIKFERNGKDLGYSSLPNHHVEDILPEGKGSQLSVDYIGESKNGLVDGDSLSTDYTCVASNDAGVREKRVRVRVLLPHDPVCHKDTQEGVTWGQSLAETDDEQLCPLDTIGTARRHCSHAAKWLEPDLSDCMWSSLTRLKTAVESVEVGFSTADSETLLRLLMDIFTFTTSQDLLHQRDLDIVVELLESLQRLADPFETNSTDSASLFQSSFVNTLKTVLSKTVSQDFALKVMTRFPYVDVQKEFIAGERRRTFLMRMKFPCEPVKFLRNVTTRSAEASRLDCPLISQRGRNIPEWTHIVMALQTTSSSIGASIGRFSPQLNVVVREAFDDADSFSRVVDLTFPEFKTFASNGSTFYTNITFNVIPPIAGLEWDDRWRRVLVDASKPHHSDFIVTCIEKHVDSVWSSESCQTFVHHMDEDLSWHVQCLCRLSNVHTSYSLRLVNTSNSSSGLPRSSGISRSFVVPITLGVIALLAGLLVVVWCFQRKKIVSCLLAVKKRTYDFVHDHVSTFPTEPSQMEIPMHTRTSFTASLPHQDKHESASLMNPALQLQGTDRELT